MLLHVPDRGGAVIGGRREVVSEGAKLDVPHRERMRLVDDQAGTGLQGPPADGAILGARKEEFIID